MGRKLALLVGNGIYNDKKFPPLVKAAVDVNALAEVLRAPNIGAFDDIQVLINEPVETIRQVIERFFAAKKRDDLLLFYFTGHGDQDKRLRWYLVGKDTKSELLFSTAIPANFIQQIMDSCNSTRQIVILDSCYSGAFFEGAKGVAEVGAHAREQLIGRGRVVLTATSATQLAWEGDEPTSPSIFTRYLVRGLKTGEADTNKDGSITVDEWFDYTYEQVIEETPNQNPTKGSESQQGSIIVAKNPLLAEQSPQQKVQLPLAEEEHARKAEVERRRQVEEDTLSLLEHLANQMNGWPARAVAFFTRLGGTKALQDFQPINCRTVDLHNGDGLDRLDGPFDELAHTVEVRRIISRRAPGRYNIPSVGLFVWRLQVYSVTEARARLLDDQGPEFFTFSVLGNDTQLYIKPTPEVGVYEASNELNFPTPIRRRSLEKRLFDYYGEDKSLFIWTSLLQYSQQSSGVQQEQEGRLLQLVWEPVQLGRIITADLTDWRYQPIGDQVVVDPVLGRIAFGPINAPIRGLRVLYHYTFSADIGGGEYNRPLFEPAGEYQLFQVDKKEGNIHSIENALGEWEKWKAEHPPADPDNPEPRNAIIEITDSGIYTEWRWNISLGMNESLQIRAANRKRPVIDLREAELYRMDALDVQGITGAAGSRIILDGLLIFGWGIEIASELSEVTIRHCTLVPGWDLEHNCEPKRANQPSLTLTNTNSRVTIEHSILGSIEVNEDEVRQKPISMKISDSILDATDNEREVLSTSYRQNAPATLEVLRCTVFGKFEVHVLELAENSIFNGLVRVARSHIGCMRFCYVPDGSLTPLLNNCQPDLVEQAVRDNSNIPAEEKGAAIQRESNRVEPVFNSRRYGTPTYCQLADTCAKEITCGSDEESEMGVFHNLYGPQRSENLRSRLDEFTSIGIEIGILYAN
jgi:uncharacterized caspase-like protein